MNPIIAIIGRANVGKSTLFNRLTKSKDALVANYAGLTRDRQYGIGFIEKKKFVCIDTGGFDLSEKNDLFHEINKQTKQAILESNIIIFLVDAKLGLTSQDQIIANFLRKSHSIIILVMNKAEIKTKNHETDFLELGFGLPIPISSEHGLGIKKMMKIIVSKFEITEKSETEQSNKYLQVAIIGRPNVGKSTLINTFLGKERVIAFNMPGTTRDTIKIPFIYENKSYILIDTVGLRRRGNVSEQIEKYSIIKTLQAIERTNVAVLVLDAQQGISEQDTRIANLAINNGKALVLAINKWDILCNDEQKKKIYLEISKKLYFLNFINIQPISAMTGFGLKKLFYYINSAYLATGIKFSTPELNRILHQAIEQKKPDRFGLSRPQMNYIHQGGSNPPIIVIHGRMLHGITRSYKRYIENYFRGILKLKGTPLHIEFKNCM